MPTVSCISSGHHRVSLLARRDALVETHMELVPPIAHSIAASLPPSFELDDLISTGYIGLLKAATNYDPQRHNGTPFSAYARPVIRGAILDSVRRGKYHANTMASLSELPERSHCPDAEGELDRARLSEQVRSAVGELGVRHRNVVDWHYGEELRLPAVGERLGVGKSRASQLHMEAVRELRSELAGG